MPFWTAFAQGFGDHRMTHALMRRFEPTLAAKGHDAMSQASDLYWEMGLNRDLTGYEIGPHTDSRGKWITALFYLPKNDSAPRNAGTCVMRSKKGKTQKEGSEWESWKDKDFEVRACASCVCVGVGA